MEFMSTTEAILEQLAELPPEQQEQLLGYAKLLAKESTQVKSGEPYCALRVAASLNLEGPPDWSRCFEEYLQESRMKHGGA